MERLSLKKYEVELYIISEQLLKHLNQCRGNKLHQLWRITIKPEGRSIDSKIFCLNKGVSGIGWGLNIDDKSIKKPFQFLCFSGQICPLIDKH